MNCIYCQNHLDGGDAGVYNCIKCPIHVRYICSGDWAAPDIYYIQFNFPKYLIEMKIVDQCTNVFYLPEPNGIDIPDNIMHLPYVPDITPQTAQEFLDRVLNLKAFY